MCLAGVGIIVAFLVSIVNGGNYILYDGKEHNRYGVLIDATGGEGSFVCRGRLVHWDNFHTYVCRRLGFKKAIVSRKSLNDSKCSGQ